MARSGRPTIIPMFKADRQSNSSTHKGKTTTYAEKRCVNYTLSDQERKQLAKLSPRMFVNAAEFKPSKETKQVPELPLPELLQKELDLTKAALAAEAKRNEEMKALILQLTTPPPPVELPVLGYQQTRIRELIVAGQSNETIASALGISVKTVKFHLTAIYKIHGVKSRLALAAQIQKGA